MDESRIKRSVKVRFSAGIREVVWTECTDLLNECRFSGNSGIEQRFCRAVEDRRNGIECAFAAVRGKRWIRMGVDCIKIEGRAKSAYYAAIVTGAYRHVIDDIVAGRPVDPIWRDEVEKVSHRIYSTGFYYGEPGQYVENSRYIRQWQVCAIVEACDENGLALCSLRNKFATGDELEVVGPNRKPFSVTAIPFSQRTPKVSPEI